MGLVDLRGRENDRDARALISCAHGSPESVDRAVARYRDGDWVLVGWRDEDELLACAGVERLSSSEVRLRSVAVAPEHRGRGIGRALLAALADVAAAGRLVAETDADAVGFYRRCGFSIEAVEAEGGRPRFRCSRVLDALAGAPEAYSPSLPIVGDLDCADIRALGVAPVRVLTSDPYRLDGDNDGLGCE